jgi:hypothetical protein
MERSGFEHQGDGFIIFYLSVSGGQFHDRNDIKEQSPKPIHNYSQLFTPIHSFLNLIW